MLWWQILATKNNNNNFYNFKAPAIDLAGAFFKNKLAMQYDGIMRLLFSGQKENIEIAKQICIGQGIYDSVAWHLRRSHKDCEIEYYNLLKIPYPNSGFSSWLRCNYRQYGLKSGETNE